MTGSSPQVVPGVTRAMSESLHPQKFIHSDLPRYTIGRRPDSGSRIHLKKGHGRPACFPNPKNRSQKKSWQSRAESHARREQVPLRNRRNQARPGLRGALFVLEFQASAFQRYSNPSGSPRPPFICRISGSCHHYRLPQQAGVSSRIPPGHAKPPNLHRSLRRRPLCECPRGSRHPGS